MVNSGSQDPKELFILHFAEQLVKWIVILNITILLEVTMHNKKKAILSGFVLFFSTALMLQAVVGDAVKTFKTPAHHPTGMCFDGEHIWLADAGTDKIYAIDPQTGKVDQEIEAPGYDPRGLAWDGKLLWCNDGSGWIYGIDVKTGISEKILESNAPNPGGLAFDGEFLWTIDRGAKKILKINRIDGMMHENIPAPSAHPNDLTFDGKYLWVTDNEDNMLYRSDPKTGDVVTFIGSIGPYPYGICWDSKNKTLWNADYQEEEIYRLDLESKEFMARQDPREYKWEITQELRNFGPGEALDVDLFIAVPQNMNNQEVLGEITYEPEPTSFVTDQWDQKFARFHFSTVPANTFLKCTLKLKARMYRTEYYIFPERVGSLNDIPKSLGKYLDDGFKYDLKNPVIQKAVKEAVGDEKNPYWIMRKIFNYIIKKIDYNLKPLGGWNPAPTVLKRGTGSCSEYSFVFIALCRAAGLPARYVGSVVIRSKDKGIDNVWHRWPEVYLPNYGWIPVDPSAEGQRQYPGGIARLIGVVINRLFITTQNGGGSEYLDFYYNFNSRVKTRGKCSITFKQYGEFVPIEKDKNL
jgi:sugar lactone lactonase YvrE